MDPYVIALVTRLNVDMTLLTTAVAIFIVYTHFIHAILHTYLYIYIYIFTHENSGS